ncbi:hypothetical protein AVEN_78673-1 [Araneus ventricosus]|uniref:Uncharacterized protein n=1 Tax=Araneus ventricosus TaxID=182803 RepID=A0A4Y2W1X6_ARAVE|nr:hypothetical protein AVEN_78673-1 [Araneus ventricosus]
MSFVVLEKMNLEANPHRSSEVKANLDSKGSTHRRNQHSRQDSSRRGNIRMDFKSIALTTRPRLLVGLQFSYKEMLQLEESDFILHTFEEKISCQFSRVNSVPVILL